MNSFETTSETARPLSPTALQLGPPLAPDAHHALIHRAVFECSKWNLGSDGRPLIFPAPLIISAEEWRTLALTAEALEREAEAAEQELLVRPELHARLGLPAELLDALAQAAHGAASVAGPRVTRFDFHPTTTGWRISEANSDVASGFNEASGVTQLFAEMYGDRSLAPAGDPAGAIADALFARLEPHARIGLMHITNFSDDRQVVTYLEKRMQELGLATCLFDARRLVIEDGRAVVDGGAFQGPIDALYRFFPAEWLPALAPDVAWASLFAGCVTPASNPAWSVLSQTKRFALVWDALETELPTWRALLPETRAPELRSAEGVELANDPRWVVKPALAHEGRDVAVSGALAEEERARIVARALAAPDAWVAQKKFDAVAIAGEDAEEGAVAIADESAGRGEGPLYPSVGVYVVAGRAAGAYGRVATRPLIDGSARDMAVLIR